MFDEKLMQVANKLVENCRNGNEMQGLDELYAENAQSYEAAEMEGGGPREFLGRQAIKDKHDFWNANFEMHSSSVDGPYLHGEDRFSVIYEMDTTNKMSGERFQMREVGVYSVQDGKIVKEEFYNAAP
ncbi:MAG: nuclear transport factor 2 family protein [Pseudomonadota bacterium]